MLKSRAFGSKQHTMSTTTARTGEARILTVPNALTALRLACVPAFLVLLAQPHARDRVAAACLLGSLGVTDGLDGYIARHFDQVSQLGKVLDPLVDRALVLAAVIGAALVGAVPWWLLVVVLARELLVLVGGVVLAIAGAKRLDVSKAGKAGAFGLMVALPLFLLGHAHFRLHAEAEVGAWVAGLWGAAWGWVAAFGYIPQVRRQVGQDARQDQSPGPAPLGTGDRG
jgi:cardiolipin synthase (CMP-forming)